jgi:hypothetical protein
MNCYEYFNIFQNDKLCFIYNGTFNDSITDKVIALSEQNVNRYDELTRLRKKVSFLIVECFQNVVRHGEALVDPSNPRGFFTARYDGYSNHISAVNLIHSDNIPELEKLLKSINTLNSESLRNLYRKMLAEPEMTGRGAGLGLIEMARKSGEPLSYDFEEMQDDLSNFYLSIELKNKQIATLKAAPLEIGKDFYKNLNHQGISLLYKGEYSQETIYPITFIAQNRMESDGTDGNSKRMFNMLVEMLQDLCRSMENEENDDGILIVANQKGKTIICAGNPVKQERKNELEARMNMINSLSLKGLERYYEKKLALGSDECGDELSLLSLARRSAAPVSHQFTEMGDGKYFYNLKVSL